MTTFKIANIHLDMQAAIPTANVSMISTDQPADGAAVQQAHVNVFFPLTNGKIGNVEAQAKAALQAAVTALG